MTSPTSVVLAGIGLLALAGAGGLLLRLLARRTRSLRHLLLVCALGALVVGAVVALIGARLMVLDGAEFRTSLGVLGATAVLAVVLVVVASGPLGRDGRALEAAVRRIEAGDLHARTGIVRADELGSVARAVDELTERLGTLERERATIEDERRVMLSSISHDLRTPLAALRAAIEALADGVAPDPDRYLRSMQRDVEALGALVDDLFLLARIEAGRLELERIPLDLSELVDEAVEALTPAADARGVTIERRADEMVRVAGNPSALGRVLRNLLDNAVQHAPGGSIVRVVVDGRQRPRVEVVDEGPGFDSDFVAHAFDRFTRADASRARGTGGAGLGLAIARGLVEAHGGRIWIGAPPGGRVSFDLPAA